MIRVHSPPSTLNMFSCKSNIPTYRDDPKRMENSFPSIFATHNPTYTDVQNLLNILLTSEECHMMLKKTREEVTWLHAKTPNNSLRANAMMPIPTVKPSWNIIVGDRG